MKRLVCLLVFLVAGAAWAQAPKPPAELKQLDPFLGTWSCKGTVYKSDFGPEHPTSFTVKSTWSLGGQWLRTDYAEMKTAKNPSPMTGLGLMGYDADAKKFVGGWVDNTGMYQTQQSDGWMGDTIIFVGPTHGAGMTGMTGKDTFVKKSASHFDHVFEIENKGSWMKVESDSCKK
ncbi:MAG TPA: DUF1579 family protein [Thermoanaerobaculia bacterium]|nr:DUF1579 family protein [Thermoanaerobaculia bacterium]